MGMASFLKRETTGFPRPVDKNLQGHKNLWGNWFFLGTHSVETGHQALQPGVSVFQLPSARCFGGSKRLVGFHNFFALERGEELQSGRTGTFA
jgi:hypothetical protein